MFCENVFKKFVTMHQFLTYILFRNHIIYQKFLILEHQNGLESTAMCFSMSNYSSLYSLNIFPIISLKPEKSVKIYLYFSLQ
jgi:hypothetical protein